MKFERDNQNRTQKKLKAPFFGRTHASSDFLGNMGDNTRLKLAKKYKEFYRSLY